MLKPPFVPYRQFESYRRKVYVAIAMNAHGDVCGYATSPIESRARFDAIAAYVNNSNRCGSAVVKVFPFKGTLPGEKCHG